MKEVREEKEVEEEEEEEEKVHLLPPIVSRLKLL